MQHVSRFQQFQRSFLHTSVVSSSRYHPRHFLIGHCPTFTLRYSNGSMSMRVYVGVCLFFNFVWMDLAVLKRLDLLQRFLCTECKNMGYFVDEASHKVEGRLRRGITITSTGLSLVLSRAEYFVRLQNRLGSHIFWWQLFISQVCWTPVISPVLECQYMRNKSVMTEPVFWLEEQCW